MTVPVSVGRDRPELLPVRGTVRSATALQVDRGATADARRAARVPGVGRLVAVGIGATGGVVTLDATIAIVLLGCAALGASLRRIGPRVRYGFGDGFLPFRREMPWPRGVQEDDDFRWAWLPADRAAERVGTGR